MYDFTADRCRISISYLQGKNLEYMYSQGFCILDVDVVQQARALVGTAKYERRPSTHRAPEVVNGPGLTHYVYGLLGLWIPTQVAAQQEFGQVVEWSDISPGDLIFGPDRVAMATDAGMVIHASTAGVCETSEISFLGNRANYRGARNIILPGHVTLQTPQHWGWKPLPMEDLFWESAP